MSDKRDDFWLFTSQAPEAVAWRRAQIIASNAIEGIEVHPENAAWDRELEEAGASVERRIELFVERMKDKARKQSAA
ncbi:hypothetical protein ACMDCR_30200 [Labrys okinawensis]|uniref:hypothetical protein n=1 Tax=Labrys okinawensis TaxID=346911 RepID=UPI0039BD09BE